MTTKIAMPDETKGYPPPRAPKPAPTPETQPSSQPPPAPTQAPAPENAARWQAAGFDF